MKRVLKVFLIAALLTLIPHISRAADLNLNIDKDTLTVGDTFDAKITIDSGDTGINAAQATLKYDTDILEAEKIEKTDSVFTFWLVEPKFDNKAGEVTFVGGATTGFTGKTLDIMDITFKVKGTGKTSLVFTDSAITASDGSGTNVLTASKGLEIEILSKSEIGSTKPPQISREPVAATNTPAKPKVEVPLYPDPTAWYNGSSDFSATWDLPGDVTDVATLINKVPDSAPAASEGLFNNKTFKALDNGVWYLHVRFKNNIGWGTTNHYRIAIDSYPPLPFKIEIPQGLSSDNPTPTMNFLSKDQFSGIDYYTVKIDDLNEIRTDKMTYTPDPLPPNNYNIVVEAHDKAGNSAEARVSIDILPIASPEILSVTKKVYVGEGGLALSGNSEPNMTIVANLLNSGGDKVLSTKATASTSGFWSLSIDDPLKNDTYTVDILAQDSRGALSLPVKSAPISVKERPILVLGGIEITYKWFLILLLAVFVVTFSAGWYIRRLTAEQRERRTLIAARDVNAVLANVKGDIEKIMEKSKNDGKASPSAETEINFILNKVDQYITKSKGYILENIEEIG